MIVSHRYRFIFVKTRKTAGTSIEVFLSQHCGPQDCVTPIDPPVDPHVPRNWRGLFNPTGELRRRGLARSTLRDLVARRRLYNHIPGYRARSRLPRSIWRDYFTFCVERNPWDKTLSHYHMMRQRYGDDLTLDDYLAAGNLCLDAARYTEPEEPGRLIVDRVLRFEHLLDDLGEVLSTLGVPFDGSLHVNAKSESRTDRRPYQDVYTNAQRDLVERAFAREIALFGYRFEQEPATL